MDIKTINFILQFLALFNFCIGIYEEAQYKEQQQQPYYREPLYKQPPSRILSHKQAQSHDGGFKFAFAADNGHAHSEVIAPDGSRNGGYTYVDPHGKTITVKYTAGKEGFKILEGDHIPRQSPAQVAAHQQAQGQQQQQSYSAPQQVEGYSQPSYQPQYPQQRPQYARIAQEEQYRPQIYPKAQSAPFIKPQYIPQKPLYAPQPRNYAPVQEVGSSNSVEENKETEYHDEPGKPHSFGAGYSFQFTS